MKRLAIVFVGLAASLAVSVVHLRATLAAPFGTAPFDADGFGPAGASLRGSFNHAGQTSYRFYIGTGDTAGSLVMDFAEPFFDGPGNDFAIQTSSDAWGPLADQARFEFFLAGQLQTSFVASLGPDQLFQFDIGGGISADRVVVTNITPDPPGINDLATMTFDDAGVAYTASAPPDNTPAGTGVAVDLPVVGQDGFEHIVSLAFDTVTSSGSTTVTASSTGSSVPAGFKNGQPPVYYEVSTTASFGGAIALCFSWQEGELIDETAAELFHYENGAWTDVTTSRDTDINQVCGQVSSLSPFAILERSFSFTGFYSPVGNPPSRNIVKAGSAVPIKFSLNGDHGLDIFAAGYPKSQQIQCDTTAPLSAVVEIVTPGASTVSYDASSSRYGYVWKTDKAWSNSCRRLLVKLSDGTMRTADFGFAR